MSDNTKDKDKHNTFTVIDGGKTNTTHDTTHNATHDVNSEDSDTTLPDNNSDTSGHDAHNKQHTTTTSIDRATDSKKPKRKLTAKQEKFARLLIEGELSQSECYRRSYNAEKMNDATVWREASLLAAHPIVTTMLRQHKDRMADASITQGVKRQQHVLNRLMVESTDDQSNASARIRALELLGRVAIDGPALFSERLEVTTESESADDVRKELESRLTALLGQRKSS